MNRALIFDLDGTLCDTLSDLQNVTNICLKKYGYEGISREECSSFIGNGIKKLLERALNSVRGNLDILDDIYLEFTKVYKEKCLCYCKVYEGINEVINYYLDLDYKLFVYTNKDQDVSEIIVNHFFKDKFIEVVGNNESHNRKPDSKVVEDFIIKYNLDREKILFVGDSNVDSNTAKNSNVKVALLTYGYGKDLKGDYLINDPRELINITQSLNF